MPGPVQPTEPRVAAWQRRTEVPMALLAVAFLAVYTVEVLATGLPGGARGALRVVDYAIWVVFVAEFLVRVQRARHRARYVSRNLLDVAMLALPFLRAARVVRLLPLLRALNRWVADSLRGKLVVYGSATAVLLVFTGALAVLDAERGDPTANLRSFGTCLWWAAVTICTVGYGDYTPVTVQGRCIAVGLMIGGIMLIGAVTASFATWLIDRLRVAEESEQAETQADLQAVSRQLASLAGELAEVKALLRTRDPGGQDGEPRPAEPASASS